MKTYSLLLALGLLFFSSWILAQQAFVVIEDIVVEGNQRTKERIVLRELSFKKGDTLQTTDIQEQIQFNSKRLSGLDLFISVNITTILSDEQKIIFIVSVKENLMWVVYPNVDLADQDINVWAQRYNFSLKRISIPITLSHLSLTGNQDKLKARIQLGFTRKLEALYISPFINQKQTLRLQTDFLFSDDREARWNTINDKDLFLREEEERLFKRTRAGIGLQIRPELFNNHRFILRFQQNSIKDTVALLNPSFFLNQQTRQRFFSIRYDFTSDHRNFNLYPTKGYLLKLLIEKEGLGIWNERNALIVDGSLAKYWSLSEKWSMETNFSGQTNLIRRQPSYYNNPVIGPEPNLIRGYELRQIRGMDYLVAAATLRYKLLDVELNLGKLMFIEKYKQGNLSVFLKAYQDAAYMNNPFYQAENRLSNQALWSRGLGMDIMVYNTGVGKIEWSFAKIDDTLQSGIFFHASLVF